MPKGKASDLLPGLSRFVQKKKLLMPRLANQRDGPIRKKGEQLFLCNILDFAGFRDRRRRGNGLLMGRGRRPITPVPCQKQKRRDNGRGLKLPSAARAPAQRFQSAG